MPIFITGVAMFAGGAVLNGLGWYVHRRSTASDEMVEWFIGILREWFSMLVGRDSTTGERLAAAGTIVSALGLVVAVVGVIAWAG